jgi:hypothetical protein
VDIDLGNWQNELDKWEKTIDEPQIYMVAWGNQYVSLCFYSIEEVLVVLG